MQEVWKPVVGYEGLYEVSNLGRVKSLPRNGTIKEERVLIPNDNGYGYLKLTLSKKNVITKYVHILVAESFLGYKANKNVIAVDHIDCNTYNNNLSNLRIISHTHNISRGNRSSTKEPNVYKVRNKFRVVLSHNGVTHHLGYFDNIEKAIERRDYFKSNEL